MHKGKIHHAPQDISNAFNDYFSTIGQNLSNNFPENSDFRKYMKTNSSNTIYMNPIVIKEVSIEINKLKINKSSGPDGVPPKVSRYASEYTSPVLTHIFNLSIEQEVFPDLFKIAKVIVLYKKGNKCLPENYRPIISLLNIFDKIFERLIYRRLISFLNKYKMLFQFQFGFREGHSTILALTEIIDNIKHNIDNNEYAIGIFLDLCKVFDTVDHFILLEKFKYNGIRGNAHALISSYLTNRTQYCHVNGADSCINANNFGVPQGSVLGPLLFLIYINDIRHCIPEDHTRLFADDTGIFVTGKSIKYIIDLSLSILKKLGDWFRINRLTVSVPKCAYVIFHGKNKILPTYIPPLYLNGAEIQRVETFKYIGLVIDSTLSFAPHVNSVLNKLNKYFGIFSHIRNKIPPSLKRQIYYATIFPHINYALEIFGSCSAKLRNKIQVKQNQLMKVLTNRERLCPTNELHLHNRILKIEDVYKIKILTFVHDCVNKNTISLFHSYYEFQSQAHSFNTRNPHYLIQPRANTNMFNSSVKYMGAYLWNNTPIAQSNVRLSKATLKMKLTQSYRNNYL